MQLISGLIQVSMLKFTDSIDIVLDYDITLLKEKAWKVLLQNRLIIIIVPISTTAGKKLNLRKI